MIVRYQYKQFKNENNLKILDRLLKRKHASTLDLAGTLTAATGVPCFIGIRLVGERIELGPEELRRMTELETFYGAEVIC